MSLACFSHSPRIPPPRQLGTDMEHANLIGDIAAKGAVTRGGKMLMIRIEREVKQGVAARGALHVDLEDRSPAGRCSMISRSTLDRKLLFARLRFPTDL